MGLEWRWMRMNGKELSGKRVTTAQKLRDWARGLKREILALYYAMKHPRSQDWRDKTLSIKQRQ